MKQEKLNIKITTESIRCNENGTISRKSFPKAFGNKAQNDFITSKENTDSIFVISSPNSTSVNDANTKLEEIYNVVYLEMYNMKEVLWPVSNYNDTMQAYNKITVDIDPDYYKEIRTVSKKLPPNMEDALKIAKKNFETAKVLYERIYGDISLKTTKHGFVISKIRKNYKEKDGISEDDVLVLVATIFTLMSEKFDKMTLKEALSKVSKYSRLYRLKAQDATKKIYEDKNRIKEEEALSKDALIKLAIEHREKGYALRYSLTKYKKVVAESVCSIKDALAHGIDYKVLNEAKSIVEFYSKGHKEFIIEGNKTDRDNYIFPIITDDKYTSKQIMLSQGLNCPQAILLEKDMDKEDLDALVSPFYNKKVVIKPRNTNYGTGITVFSKPATKAQIMKAIEYAFKFDNNLLVEEYAKGMEYRFLVIDGKCLSVAHRRTASVVGDGKSNIKELIEIKNKEPWHALTGSPVKVDEPVTEYLKLQGLTFESVIPKGKRIFLRTNSNVSTGGESIDYTYTMPAKFKKIAEKASKAFDAKICGVDIIIEDFKKDNYSIIEINDNPGYSINEWPYEGEGEKIGLAVLDLLKMKHA